MVSSHVMGNDQKTQLPVEIGIIILEYAIKALIAPSDYIGATMYAELVQEVTGLFQITTSLFSRPDVLCGIVPEKVASILMYEFRLEDIATGFELVQTAPTPRLCPRRNGIIGTDHWRPKHMHLTLPLPTHGLCSLDAVAAVKSIIHRTPSLRVLHVSLLRSLEPQDVKEDGAQDLSPFDADHFRELIEGMVSVLTAEEYLEEKTIGYTISSLGVRLPDQVPYAAFYDAFDDIAEWAPDLSMDEVCAAEPCLIIPQSSSGLSGQGKRMASALARLWMFPYLIWTVPL